MEKVEETDNMASDSDSDESEVEEHNLECNDENQDATTNAANMINDLANKAAASMVPGVSAHLYEVQYLKFSTWRNRMEIKKTDETVLLAYFQLLSETYKATSLWSTYTRLKSMLIFKENIDIGKYCRLQCFLKTKSKGHKVKKSKVFSNQEITKFLRNAPDDEYLLHKVSRAKSNANEKSLSC